MSYQEPSNNGVPGNPGLWTDHEDHINNTHQAPPIPTIPPIGAQADPSIPRSPAASNSSDLPISASVQSVAVGSQALGCPPIQLERNEQCVNITLMEANGSYCVTQPTLADPDYPQSFFSAAFASLLNFPLQILERAEIRAFSTKLGVIRCTRSVTCWFQLEELGMPPMLAKFLVFNPEDPDLGVPLMIGGPLINYIVSFGQYYVATQPIVAPPSCGGASMTTMPESHCDITPNPTPESHRNIIMDVSLMDGLSDHMSAGGLPNATMTNRTMHPTFNTGETGNFTMDYKVSVPVTMDYGVGSQMLEDVMPNEDVPETIGDEEAMGHMMSDVEFGDFFLNGVLPDF